MFGSQTKVENGGSMIREVTGKRCLVRASNRSTSQRLLSLNQMLNTVDKRVEAAFAHPTAVILALNMGQGAIGHVHICSIKHS